MILNWLSILISARWMFPLISGTTLVFIETVCPFFHLSNTVTMGVVISFGLLALNVNTVSLTLPSVVSFKILTIYSVIYVLWLPASIRTLVISDFDWPLSIASINTVCIITCSRAASTDCLSLQSSTKSGAVLVVRMLLDGGFFFMNSLGHRLRWWLFFPLQWWHGFSTLHSVGIFSGLSKRVFSLRAIVECCPMQPWYNNYPRQFIQMIDYGQ